MTNWEGWGDMHKGCCLVFIALEKHLSFLQSVTFFFLQGVGEIQFTTLLESTFSLTVRPFPPLAYNAYSDYQFVSHDSLPHSQAVHHFIQFPNMRSPFSFSFFF